MLDSQTRLSRPQDDLDEYTGSQATMESHSTNACLEDM